jgi:hypothetical protein
MITPDTFLTEAKSWLETQYHHQGRLKRTQNYLGGVDCIGLVIGICEAEIDVNLRVWAICFNLNRRYFTVQSRQSKRISRVRDTRH